MGLPARLFFQALTGLETSAVYILILRKSLQVGIFRPSFWVMDTDA